MALYVIGDTHLSLGGNKPMDVFGGAWVDYVEKLRQGFQVVQPEDTVVLAGDLSWGMSLPEAREDFAFLHALPGKKILLKGNHDYWWATVTKMEQFFAAQGFDRFSILHNNCILYEDYAVCGTRGWFFEEEMQGLNQKVFNRELLRLETSLRAAGEREKICVLHYPPCYQGYQCEPILELLGKYGVKRCYYGHLHGGSHRLAIQGMVGETEYRLISADYIQFRPEKILD